MPRSLADIVLAARARTDTEDSQAPADTYVYQFVNQALRDLQRIVAEVNENAFLKYQDFTIASGNTAPLPSDFYGMKLLEKDPTSSWPKRIDPFEITEKNRVGYLGYQLETNGRSLYLVRPENAQGNYRIWYTPEPDQLDVNNPTTSFVSANLSPFDGYLIVKTAILILDAIQDPETGRLDNDLAEQEAIVRNAFARRDQGPRQAPDVRTRAYGRDYLNDPFFWS